MKENRSFTVGHFIVKVEDRNLTSFLPQMKDKFESDPQPHVIISDAHSGSIVLNEPLTTWAELNEAINGLQTTPVA